MDSSTSGKAETGSPTDENVEDVGYEDVDLGSPDASPEAPAPATGSSFGEKLVSAVTRPLTTYLGSSTSTSAPSTSPKKQEERETSEERHATAEETVSKPEIPDSAVAKDTGDNPVQGDVEEDVQPTTVAESRTTEDGEPVYNVRSEEKHENAEEAAKRLAPAMSTDTERIAAVVAKETPDETFARLRKGIADDGISSKEVVNSVFQVVSVPFFGLIRIIWDCECCASLCLARRQIALITANASLPNCILG